MRTPPDEEKGPPVPDPLIVAHRGASAAHPPGNTIEAFRAAAPLGAAWVELDVRRTADGALAVHHDPTLADGRPLVEVESGDLPALVPLLADALEACAGLGVNIEIKNSEFEGDFDEDRRLVDQVLELLDGRDPERFLITSFDPGSVGKVRSLGSPVRTGLLVLGGDTVADAMESAARAGHVAINPWAPFVDAALVAQADELGLEVHVWTVDDVPQMRRLVDLGVHAIITNVPDVLRDVLAG